MNLIDLNAFMAMTNYLTLRRGTVDSWYLPASGFGRAGQIYRVHRTLDFCFACGLHPDNYVNGFIRIRNLSYSKI